MPKKENMGKLWQKGKTKLDPFIEAFETKGDLIMDQKLVEFDVLGSIAHAKMLNKIGILTKTELEKLIAGLNEVSKLNKEGKFNLQLGDEDVHTKIENYLTQKYADVGQKIHTGRSRNDQVLTTLRLYTKEQINLIKNEVKSLQISFTKFGQKYQNILMPGLTHMQKAMPSSVGLWVKSFTDSLIDDLIQLECSLKLNDQSPLGTGASYGIPLKIDKGYSANLLGFAKIQQNPIYAQNSRAKIEAATLGALISILTTINKFASDILLFTTEEFNYFQVSDSLTTGSSIMPQKKNLDIAELLRSKVHLVLGNYVQIVSVGSNLISGYNRDFQDSKKPLIESLEITLESLKVANILLKNLKPNKENLKKAMTEDLYATKKAYDLVKKGIPFRKAYQEIKDENTD